MAKIRPSDGCGRDAVPLAVAICVGTLTVDYSFQCIRLHGIDASEIGQVCSMKGESWSCGRAAADLLRDLIDGQEVDCRAAAYVRLALLIGSQGLEGRLITCAEPRIRPFMTPFPLTYSRS